MTSPSPVLSSRHGWLKHLVKGLEDDPVMQYKVHIWAVRIWIVNMIAVLGVYMFANNVWTKASVLYLVMVSLYANLATDYGAASAAMAAGGLGATALPEIPLEPAAAAHYSDQAAIRRLMEENTVLIKQVADQTALLDEIHSHVSALAPQAGQFAPGEPVKPRKET